VGEQKIILLYRYLDAQSALKSIESRSLRISRLHELNDPFEWRLAISGIPAEGEPSIEKWISSILANQSKIFGLMCFSAICKEPVLWSHYAENRRVGDMRKNIASISISLKNQTYRHLAVTISFRFLTVF
jgi:hypothetical protein